MPRNKYPEQTVEQILAVSYRLFNEKGYEETTIQDIVQELGMSKGAVYHHFKSKADILEQIFQQFYHALNRFDDILTDPNLTGLEKIKNLFEHDLLNDQKLELEQLALPAFKSPSMAMQEMRSTVEEIAPMIANLIQEGIDDGSIPTKCHPQELSEALLLLINTWVNPAFFKVGKQQFLNKILFLKQMTDSLGLPLVDDQFLQHCAYYFSKLYKVE